ncbi:MAG TPA: hypothetical protein VHK90_18600 [Thermoanaerobaculia bacterium]|nr:hypothetical protein [Thermoanaerobaculia bacterium]
MLCVTALPAFAIVDFTPPVVTPNVSGTVGGDGWFTSDVAISWTLDDPESTAAVLAGCEPVLLTTDTDGTTFFCSALSLGGITTMTYTVRRDATAPVVTYVNAKAVYGIDETISIFCNASDALSGVASTTCQDITGSARSFLTTNTFSATATDVAGNTGSASITFTIEVSASSLSGLIAAWVPKESLARNLQRRLERGDIVGFIRTVERESGKNIAPADAAELIRLALLI